MIDALVKDFDTKMTEAETEEKLAQEEYEELMADYPKARCIFKSITTEEGEKADTLLKYFNMRKEARTGEIDSLKKAKAVLSGKRSLWCRPRPSACEVSFFSLFPKDGSFCDVCRK